MVFKFGDVGNEVDRVERAMRDEIFEGWMREKAWLDSFPIEEAGVFEVDGSREREPDVDGSCILLRDKEVLKDIDRGDFLRPKRLEFSGQESKTGLKTWYSGVRWVEQLKLLGIQTERGSNLFHWLQTGL